VIGIIGILFTLGYVNFQDYSRQQNLLATARSLQNDLKSAQEAAIAGNKPASCNTYLNGYKFSVDSNTSYSIIANCTPNIDIVTKQVNLGSGVTISAPNPNPIFFKALAQGTNIVSGGTASILLTQTLTGRTVTVTIGANGNVQ
jgi:type II secretory pathway pseudopilin PulG